MKHTITYSAVVVLSLSLCSLGLSGCDAPDESESTTPPSPSATADGSGDKDAHGSHEHADHDEDGLTDMEKMKAELAKLSPEDAALAEKQHFCPVSGDMLGIMGPPIKIDVNGQQIWICCEGCRESLLENPDEYLAKLKNQ